MASEASVTVIKACSSIFHGPEFMLKEPRYAGNPDKTAWENPSEVVAGIVRRDLDKKD